MKLIREKKEIEEKWMGVLNEIKTAQEKGKEEKEVIIFENFDKIN